MNDIASFIFAISCLSFCMSFSGSFITFTKTSNPLAFSIKNNVILRAFGEFLGYFSRILVGFFIDRLQKRMPFLIAGYVPVVFLKLLTFLIFLPIFPTHIKVIIFIFADIMDITLNSARDIARDCYIADICVNNDSLLNKALNIRKSISLFGTAFGMVTFSTYYYFYPVLKSYAILSGLSMIVATIGVIILFTFIREKSQHLINASRVNINLFSMMQNKMWIGFLAMFLLAFTKTNHFVLFQHVINLITIHYPQYQKYTIFISTSLLPISYYIFGALTSFLLSNFSFKQVFWFFIILACIINYFHIFHIVSLSSIIILIILNLLYGCYNNIFDNIINTIILKVAHKNNIIARGTILATSNIIMGLANLLLGTILSYINIPIFKFIQFGVIPNLCGLGLLIYLISKYNTE